MNTTIKRREGPFEELAMIAMTVLGCLILVGGVMIAKSEISAIKVTDRDLMCSRHGMRYVYARMDMCVDEKGQIWSMWALNKGEPVPMK